MIARSHRPRAPMQLLPTTLLLTLACIALTNLPAAATDSVYKSSATPPIPAVERTPADRAIQVSVEMRLLTVPRDFLQDQKFHGLKLVMDLVLEKGRPANALLIDDAAAVQFIRAAQAEINTTTLTAPRATVHNGQEGSIHVLQNHPYRDGYSAPKPDGRRDPTFATANSGIKFDFQPTVSADRRFVNLNLHPRIAILRKLDEQPLADDPKLTIQNPDLAVQEITANVSIPDRGTLLMALAPIPDKPDQVLLMLAKPAIILPPEP
jgi:type II secretory pathway component GspD/PulD (secretin)